MDCDFAPINHDDSTLPLSGVFFPYPQHFKVENSILVGQQTNIYHNGTLLLEKLASNTIPGAAFNSSARDPPPRCHPLTRTSILQRLHNWLNNPEPPRRILWLHGPAGVGKSAIIQTVAETLSSSILPQNYSLGATIFFSKPNNREDARRVFATVACQLVARFPAYREFVISQLAIDPLLVDKSIAEQFRLFFVIPFAERQIDQKTGPFIVILDGLDECKGDREQVEIIRLVSQFIAEHPDVPVLWIMASRPEPHICNAFSRPEVSFTVLEETVPINSDEACEDVERYLRGAFQEIRENHPECFAPRVQWPMERQFLELCAVASGNFALAATVIRFVEDPDLSAAEVTCTSNPLAALDALYTRIFFPIPHDTLPTTMRILAFIGQDYPTPCADYTLSYLCPPQKSLMLTVPCLILHVYHSSLIDFLHDPERSGLLSVPSHHHYEDGLQAIVRILSQAIKSGQLDSTSISLSWPSLQLGADNPHSLTLLVAALQSFFKFFDEATSLQPTRREVQLQIAHLLEHLDLAEAFSMIGTSLFWKHAYQGFRKFLDDPRNHALANVRAIRVNEIDFSKISQERLCYVFLDVRGPKEFSLPMRPRGFNTIGRVVGNSDLEIGMKEKFLICYASNLIHIDGMRQVLPDLRSLPGDEPSAPICT
ncbi:hypothetical protein NP233_g13009 [Leucocoprinus birnbaumii]|uniref:NACHT domain-containing protein n=1 Tax=Leucocoprinus birnbaumii TaxID=56174 RepID=A0AAD5VFF1_9AGAR|nr:hypothetical protein NP233_g13009 [Leucocoprinus birnbaumii]